MANSYNISAKNSIIDLFSINANKLIAYSSGLVYGNPSIINKQLSFEPFQYLHIEHLAFEDWCEFLIMCVNYHCLTDIERKLPENNIQMPFSICNHVDFQDSKNNVEYQWNIIALQSDQIISEITAKGHQTTVFSFQQHEIITLIQGFETLFFKVYLYPLKIHMCIKTTINNITTSYVQNKQFHDILAYFLSTLTEEEAFYATELVLRHHKIMVGWQQLLKIITIM